MSVAFPEDFPHQENSRQEDETEPSSASMVPSSYWKYHQVCQISVSNGLDTMRSVVTGSVLS